MITGRSRNAPFNPENFLTRVGVGRKIEGHRKGATIFAQGDLCDAVFYIQSGKVKLTVVSKAGKEATIGILEPGEFFGEDSLMTPHARMGTATALIDCRLMRIEKDSMVKALQDENKLSHRFVEHLLAKNIRYREDLIDHLFNSSEKRLARILLLFAGFGKEGISETTEIPKISQETLAEMVGTTRSRVSSFMNKFRKLGFIEYDGRLEVHSSLLTVVLHD